MLKTLNLSLEGGIIHDLNDAKKYIFWYLHGNLQLLPCMLAISFYTLSYTLPLYHGSSYGTDHIQNLWYVLQQLLFIIISKLSATYYGARIKWALHQNATICSGCSKGPRAMKCYCSGHCLKCCISCMVLLHQWNHTFRSRRQQ